MHIPGSAKLVDSLFLTALERATWPRATAAEKRHALIEVKGFAHQIIRIAQLLEAGRNLTAIEQCYSEDDFDGVNYDEEHFLIIPASVRGKSSIDAREGSTLIEIKSLPLDQEISRLLTAILSGPLPKSGLPVIPDDASRRAEDQQPPAFLATKMANQLLRYRRLLDQGVGELLELHLTSGLPLAQELVDAIARFFRGRVRLFQYEHLLTEHATPLLPSPVEPLADGAHAPAPPDEFAAPPPLLSPEAEVAPSPPAAAPVVPATPVEPEAALSRIEPPEGERALELDDEIRQHVMTAEFFRRARIGDDFERVDRFIEWLLTETTAANGTLEALSATSPAESMRIFLALYESWEKSSPSTEARIRLPADIPDKRAQDRFNGYLRSINGHTIDWGARVDKETCVSHIREALAALMHETAAELHPPFKRRIKQLYDDMALYEPSYIGTGKTADFKPRLREIMKEYLWIEEGRTKEKR
jgi:hypothetical protein